MNLREEIDELLYREMFEPYGISQTNFIRDGVLRIFKKRIDNMIKERIEYINQDFETNSSVMKNLEFTQQQELIIEAFRLIKKEMLLK